ncbi:hypothetical protein DIPPA_35727 [Diplonema papillatum]|nr:hypothetical protein DIPPA_35727 [Diplonema papillatum]
MSVDRRGRSGGRRRAKGCWPGSARCLRPGSPPEAAAGRRGLAAAQPEKPAETRYSEAELLQKSAA